MAIDSEPSGSVDDDRTPLDPVGGQDGYLRLVDDRHGEVGAEGPVIGDREGAAADVVGRELAGPGPIGQVPDPSGHSPERDLLGPVDDGHDQPLVVEVDGDAEVHLVVEDQGLVAHRGVEVRVVPQRLDRRPRDEGQVGEREALLGLEALPPRTADPFDVLEVRLVGDEGVRRGGLGADHVLGGPPPHVREGHDPVPCGDVAGHGGRRRRNRRGRCHDPSSRGRRHRRSLGGDRRSLRCAGGLGRAAAGGAAPACWRSITPSTSSRVIRPPTPVPVTWRGSIRLSASRRRTTGERSRGSSTSGPAGAGPKERSSPQRGRWRPAARPDRQR